MSRLPNIDQLVEAGLAPIKKLPYARIVLSDVQQGITSMVYRNLAIEMFSKITNYILNDQILYQRLRQLLMNDHFSSRAFEALIKKADKAGLSLDVILEVYERGMKDTSHPHLTREQNALNRVDSFIAGGLARKLDADLIEDTPSDREWG